MNVSPTEKKNPEKRFPPYMYKKNLASLKIPTPQPNHFFNGPSLSKANITKLPEIRHSEWSMQQLVTCLAVIFAP